MAIRGDMVLVKTFGGYPRLRRLWAIDRVRAIVAEPDAYNLLKRGADIGSTVGVVGVPAEDVFLYDGRHVDEHHPMARWDNLVSACPGSI